MTNTISPQYLGALDQGTTSTRFMVFARAGNVVASAQKEHRQIYPNPGWVEHDPLEILRNTHFVIAEAMDDAGLKPVEIASVGITNQRETTVVWDRQTGAPIYNAIVWQDTRVADAVALLVKDGGQDRFRKQTGLPLSTYFSGLKIAWILDHVEGARGRAEKGELLFGNIDAFLLWNLTGGAHGGIHATDVTNAGRTQLMNLDTLAWDAELLSALNVPAAMLPEIRSSSEHYGDLSTTRLKGTPVCAMLGDQHAALVGQTCFEPGELKNTYGTGCFLLMNTGTEKVESTSGLLTTLGYKFGKAAPVYALEGSIAVTGSLVQWLRDNLGLIGKSEDIEALAMTVPDNGGVFFVPAFSGLYAPWWRDSARGTICGLTRYANKGHIARAVLESTALQTRDVVEAMESDSGIALKQLRTDGGMVVNETLMQFQADILNVPVVRPKMRETTALGAAYAAGLACGFYKDTTDLVQNWAIDKTWNPALDETARERHYAKWKKAITRSFDWED
ncbi:glycerol kinase [Granulicella pectinivorans]|uniref:Glycerol kinase n=1 Tax=Granulicella pectinivorans TaxID=474950 RepID=A0A1I6LTR3_9BACT|nr:glycerol kinase GlpK [Granulicella pectinivorans]SFS06861.1 glycerol kinase [Granulicella pectinivorans]